MEENEALKGDKFNSLILMICSNKSYFQKPSELQFMIIWELRNHIWVITGEHGRTV